MSNSTHEEDVLFLCVYSVVFITGLVLNLTALVIFFLNSKIRSHTTMYMIHLAVADILMICTLPVRIYYHAGGVPKQKFCEFTGLILLSNMYSSIFLLTSISFDRCVAVCFPLSSRVRECRKKAWCICLAIWLLTIGASLPIYLKDSYNSSTEQKNYTCFGGFPTYATQPGPLFGTITVGFGIPLIIIIISSWGLIRAIGKSTAAQTDNLVDSGRIKRMIITNLAIFLLCFLPYHIMLVLLYKYGNTSKLLLKVYSYSLMVACLNAMLDPLAYYFATETFRGKIDIGAVRKNRQVNSHS